jgi:hypothetical protein
LCFAHAPLSVRGRHSRHCPLMPLHRNMGRPVRGSDLLVWTLSPGPKESPRWRGRSGGCTLSCSSHACCSQLFEGGAPHGQRPPATAPHESVPSYPKGTPAGMPTGAHTGPLIAPLLEPLIGPRTGPLIGAGPIITGPQTMPPGLQTMPPGLPTMPPGLQTMPPGLPTMPPGLPTMPPGPPTRPPRLPTGAPPIEPWCACIEPACIEPG